MSMAKFNPLPQKVSIIISLYNLEDYVEKCLQSCIRQDYPNLEILVIDDGSTDRSFEICQQYAAKDKRIHIIKKKNEGLYLARKTGVDYASGDFVFFLDADDYISDDCILKLYKLLQINEGMDIVYGNLFVEDEAGTVIVSDPPLSIGTHDAQEMLTFAISHYSWHIWGNLIRKDLLKQVVYWTDLDKYSFGEDAITMLQLHALSKSIYVSNDPVYFYLQRSSSIMHQKRIELLHKNNFQFAKMLGRLAKLSIFSPIIQRHINRIALEKMCVCLKSGLLSQSQSDYVNDFVRNHFLSERKVRYYFLKHNRWIYMVLWLQSLSPSILQFIYKVYKH